MRRGILDEESNTDFNIHCLPLERNGMVLSTSERCTSLLMDSYKQSSYHERIYDNISERTCRSGLSSYKYITNWTECMNNIPKLHINYHKCSWVQLTNTVNTLITKKLKRSMVYEIMQTNKNILEEGNWPAMSSIWIKCRSGNWSIFQYQTFYSSGEV